MRDNAEKLWDIIEAIERINRYAVLGKTNFEQNELVQVWMTQNLQIIGEASRALSAEFREKHPEIPGRGVERVIVVKEDQIVVDRYS